MGEIEEAKDLIRQLIRENAKISYQRGYAEGLLLADVTHHENDDPQPDWVKRAKDFLND